MSFSLHAESDASAPRRSERARQERQEPVRLQAEQEGEALARDEAADVEAALLLSLQGDDEKGEDAVDIAAALSDEERSSDEQEEKNTAPAAPSEWHMPTVLREPPRMARHVAAGTPMRLPRELTRLHYLQLFLMPELMECLPPDRRPRRTAQGPTHRGALAHTHFSVLTHETADCVVCSEQPAHRKRTNYICSTCQLHMCLGACFSSYHSA